MWAPVVKGLMAVPEIRERYQLWFFDYPTGQPIPLSALQLREALDEALLTHRVKPSLILIGHSMGGILAPAQDVSRITPEAALRNSSQCLEASRRAHRSPLFDFRSADRCSATDFYLHASSGKPTGHQRNCWTGNFVDSFAGPGSRKSWPTSRKRLSSDKVVVCRRVFMDFRLLRDFFRR